MGFINKFSDILKIGKGKARYDVEKYLDRVDKEPESTKAHLKLAKFYERRGETEEAIKEYLLAAATFTRNGLYPQALTVYKHILKENPTLDKVELKIAETYGKMGSLENAYSVYGRLLKTYNKQGREDKAQEVMCMMAELSMQKITMGEKVQTSSEGSQLFRPTSGNAASGNIPKSMPTDREKKKIAFDLGADWKRNSPWR